jgi:hypothetical protein
MPKKPIDYSKCCIYKIEHIENENLLYVGHTTEFNKRKNRHKSNCYNQNDNSTFNFKLYQMIRENGGFEMFKMIEVEKYPCNDKREAEKRENEVMKELKANMNSNNSYITEEEKKKNNREYKINNRAKLIEKQKEYHKKNNDIIKFLKKKYRENNKENIKKQEKEYREKNKDIIKEKKSEKLLCECGCIINKRNSIRHQATKKHIDIMNKKNF